MTPKELRALIPLLEAPDPPIYFDNACMTLKPRPVIEAIARYYEQTPVCAGRATYELSRRVSEQVAASRQAMAGLLGAESPDEIVFTRNTTEAINLALQGLELPTGSTLVTTDREHNSNLVPLQRLAKQGHDLVVLPSTDQGAFDLDALEAVLRERDVALVSVVHMSNLDGYVTPLAEIVELAHDHGALVLADGAQAAPHRPVSVRDLDVDLYALSIHKMMGPTGVGVLYGRHEILDGLEPLIVGGSTIRTTTYEGYELDDVPARFEAGLQDYAGLVAVAPTVDVLERIGLDKIRTHERALSQRLVDGIQELGGAIIGSPEARGNGIVSFSIGSLDPQQLAILLEDKGNALVRAGLHCMDSWFHAQGLEGSCRASLYAYNTAEEVESFLATLQGITGALQGR